MSSKAVEDHVLKVTLRRDQKALAGTLDSHK